MSSRVTNEGGIRQWARTTVTKETVGMQRYGNPSDGCKGASSGQRDPRINPVNRLTRSNRTILSFFSRGRSKRKWSLDSNIKGRKLGTKERAVARVDYTSITAPCLENDKQLKGS